MAKYMRTVMMAAAVALMGAAAGAVEVNGIKAGEIAELAENARIEVSVPVPVSGPRPGIAEKYLHLDPMREVPDALLSAALEYFDVNLKRIRNRNYLSVVDFSRHSSKKRFFIIDMRSGEVLGIRVAHGAGSDPENTGYARLFSNVPESKKSSLGFYLANETYFGMWGLSVKLDGLSTDNSQARARNIVLHGYAPVLEADIQTGASWGCLAVSLSMIEDVAAKLHGGSLIYAGLGGKEAPVPVP